MEPRGIGTGWLCIAVLCSGAALVLQTEEPTPQSTTQHDTPEPTGPLTTSSGHGHQLTTWPTATPSPPWTEEPITISMPTGERNKPSTASAVPIRYWSPAIFVLVALLVLFFTYRRTKGAGSRDRAASISDSSDWRALDQPGHDITPIIPSAQEERKGPEQPPALAHTETTFCEPDPSLPQPGTPPAAGDPHCSEEPSAD
ncbi:uncharacterized protein LOC133628362 isoform X2 [Colius striatus]|uniref:uncharacterized protein LOC133628362 isoform X2 n=1 Tax=Colius striatus TaxID=57412 RepID=UPI002B1CF703|nr:uncharacterized protein LOC133628362 isoform X2 [Colius striatus]